MPPTKNEMAATLDAASAARVGILSADQARSNITSNSRKLYGFSRKLVPTGLPTEPKIYIFSISEYGELVDLGPGFKKYLVEPKPDDPEALHGPPCAVDPINFFEEAKVDQTEHTFTSGEQIANAIMKLGPGMNPALDRRRVGWFMSDRAKPRPEEITRAIELYRVECKRLYTEAQSYFTSNRLNEITDTHRRAARYLNEKVDWDKPVRQMNMCVGCGERVPSGAIIHTDCGAVQPGKWAEAIYHGMKTMEQAPKAQRAGIAKALAAMEDVNEPEVEDKD